MLVKMLHTFAAALSLSGFVLRGYWMTRDSSLLERRLTRILPHVIDTVFLLSGIALALMLGTATLTQDWMIAKWIGLALYIVLGTIALKRGRTLGVRIAALTLAVLVFVYIVGVAISRSATSWLILAA